MNSPQARQLNRLRKVKDFGLSHIDIFPLGSYGGQLFAEISTLIEDIPKQAIAQTNNKNAKRQNQSSKTTLRKNLKANLEDMRRTARAIALDGVGNANQFVIPKSLTDESLLETARSFINNAIPLQNNFIQHAMPGDFINSLQNQVNDFEKHLSLINQTKEARMTASGTLNSLIKKSAEIFLKLDATVRNTLKHNDTLLNNWLTISRLETPPRKNNATKPMEATPKSLSATDTN